jgi:hypothetical protein
MSAPFYAVFGLFIVLGLIAYVCDRATRKRPKRMATRVKRSRWEDAKPRDSRDVMAIHWRIVNRQ